MEEINDFTISDFTQVFSERILPGRYYDLIEEFVVNYKKLNSINIYKVSDFVNEQNAKGIVMLANEAGIDTAYLGNLNNLIKIRSFRPIKITKIIDNEDYVNILYKFNMIDTQDMLLKCNDKRKARELAEKTKVPYDDLVKLCKVADLSRLPGVKEIRAIVYYEAGLDCVETISKINPNDARDRIADYLQVKRSRRIPPQPKEITAQVEWAKITPRLIDFQ